MKYKLLRLSLLSVLCVLFGGGIYAITNALMDASTTEPEVTLDFTAKANWPLIPTSGSANKDLTSFTNSDETYTIKLYATNNYKMNDGYLILGKKDSYLELPAFNFDVEKIEVTGSGSASESVKQNIYVGDNAVSTETTGAKGVTNTYEIASDYQAAGNIYKLVVTSAHNTQITYIKVYKKTSGNPTDNRTETTVTFADGYATSGAVGDVLDLPVVTISAGGTPIDAVPTWESDNEGVANIANGKLNLMTKGTAKITASFAGDNDLKPSSKSYTVIVCDKYTTIAAILENITSTKTDMVFEFTDLLVTYVKNNYTYVSDGTDAIQFYGSESGLKAGDKITGSISGKVYTYNNLPEITDYKLTVTAKTEGNEVTFTPIAPDALANNINKPIIIDNAVYVSVDNNNYNFIVGETSFVVRNTWGIDLSALTVDKAYKLTGMGSVFKTTNQLNLISFEDATTDEPAEFKDFAAIVNNQTGTLLTTEEQVQGTAVEFGVAVDADGKTVRVAKDDVSSIATISGKYHSEHGLTNMKVVTDVPGAVKIIVGKCTYGNTKITVTNKAGETVAEYTPQGEQGSGDLVCWKNSAENVMELTYTGEATTLTITGMKYCPFIEVKKYEAPDEPIDGAPVTATWDFENKIPASIVNVNIQGADATGTVDSDVEGIKLNVLAAVAGTNIKLQYNSQGYAQFNQNTCIQVPVISTSDVVTVVSYPGQSKYTVGGEDATGQNEFSHTATADEVKKGYVEIIATATAYIYAIKVVQNPSLPPIPQDVTATWDFVANCANLAKKGTEGSSYTAETMASNVEGISMTIVYNGGVIKNNDNSYQVGKGVEMQIPVKNVGDLVTVRGYNGYSKYTIGNNTEELTNESSYKAKKSDVDAGYVAVTSCDNNNYYYSISVVQYAPSTEPVLVEKSIYKTDFSEWTTFSASTTDPVVVNKTTKYTNENLDFSVFNTALMTTEDSKFANYTTLPHNTLRAEKAATPYVTTSALGNITKVRFIHGATGGSRGWKLEAKGDGDADWVVISDSYANPSSWCEVTKDINKTNCQLRFTNLTSDQNAYLFELEIFGKVDLTGAPLLESLTYNNKTYNADDIFEMGNSDNYEATIELFRSDVMPSAENPVTAVAANGEIGEITYQGAGYGTMVTIPVTAEGKTVKYVANFQLKPMLTLSYIGVDGETVLGTQQVEKDAEIGEFAVDIETVSSLRNGYKARGWFKQNYVGEKYTTASTFAEDSKLYAVETEIEVASTSRKYEFNLADKFFYAEDHEAFTPQEGAKCKFHDTTHGWSVYNGDKIDLLVGPKAIISIATCRYGHLDKILVKKGEETLAELQGMDADTDGKVVSYTYEGESGTLTLEIVAPGGESYIHSVKIANVAETNYEQDGQWLFVKAGDVSSFIDALEIANGTAGEDRLFIFLPNGIYDLGTAVQTPISRDNVSLIGESMEGTIIKNAPPTSKEGLMSASTIHNTGNNLYMQDLTLQNDLDYYGAGAAGRANAFHDGGDKTIAKNVKLMSYQDTYLTPANKQTYWETSEIHGAVDFICGGGDIFFEKCDLVTESRKKGEKSGEATIVAPQPQTAEKFGYVFNNCTIENQAATFNFGRAWGGASGATVGPMAAYLNTTLNQPNEIRATRFITAGMNEAADKFKEYNSMDKDGNVVSPASNVLKFTHSTGDKEYETILTADEAAGYALDKVFPDWTPADYTVQVEAPAAELKDGTISWTPANNGAIAYAIFKNGALLGITTGTSYVIDAVAETGEAAPRRAEVADKYTIRAANPRGGFGEAKEVKDAATGISTVKNGQQTDTIYNMQGVRVNNAQKGVYIINGKKVVIK